MAIKRSFWRGSGPGLNQGGTAGRHLKQHESSNGRRPVLAALSVGMVLLAGAGVGHRLAAERYARPGTSDPLAPGTLAKLPLKLGGWTGQDVPLDEDTVSRTDTDQHVNRLYQRGGSMEAVSLFVAYGVRLRDLMPHRPEVCYPGAGWTLKDSQRAELPLEDGRTLPCQIQRFVRGGLEAKRITVLNYYIVDGSYCPDVELLRSKAWRLTSRGRYVAQVQITCTDSVMNPDGEGSVRAFAALAAGLIRRLMPEDTSAALEADAG